MIVTYSETKIGDRKDGSRRFFALIAPKRLFLKNEEPNKQPTRNQIITYGIKIPPLLGGNLVRQGSKWIKWKILQANKEILTPTPTPTPTKYQCPSQGGLLLTAKIGEGPRKNFPP